jgi:glutamate formiminotransferase/formiminotetrahydrofolate cyclodeaminase
MSLIECVPNFSEGRNSEVVHAIRDAIAAVPGASVLDVSMDASHHRSVITFVAPAETVGEAAFAAIREAQRRIDLTTHHGCHPRLGAADVVPFVPLAGATMADCVRIAREVGARVAEELGIPVYLYEHAATRPERRNLAEVRRGGFEGLRDLVATDPSRAPDFGPSALHPTCGAVAIGARDLLIAYNVYLGPAGNLAVAREVARAVRGSSGGLRGVKALALEVDGQAQVSMNLVDPDRTTMHQAFDLVRLEAEARGVAVTWSEIVGLAPERALVAAGARHLRLARFTPSQLLEVRLREERGEGLGGARWLAQVAEPSPTPGVGSVAAYAAALAAAVGGMTVALTAPRDDLDAGAAATAATLGTRAAELRGVLVRLADADTAAYAAVSAARLLPREGDEATTARRDAALAAALLASTQVPHDVARHATEVTRLGLAALDLAPVHLTSDAFGACVLAEAAATAADAVVRANAASLARHSAYVRAGDVAALVATSGQAAAEARAHRAAAQAVLDARLPSSPAT